MFLHGGAKGLGGGWGLGAAGGEQALIGRRFRRGLVFDLNLVSTVRNASH